MKLPMVIFWSIVTATDALMSTCSLYDNTGIQAPSRTDHSTKVGIEEDSAGTRVAIVVTSAPTAKAQDSETHGSISMDWIASVLSHEWYEAEEINFAFVAVRGDTVTAAR